MLRTLTTQNVNVRRQGLLQRLSDSPRPSEQSCLVQRMNCGLQQSQDWQYRGRGSEVDVWPQAAAARAAERRNRVQSMMITLVSVVSLPFYNKAED